MKVIVEINIEANVSGWGLDGGLGLKRSIPIIWEYKTVKQNKNEEIF